MDSIKPGWETTEFWATVFTMFVGLFLTVGFITPQQATAATAQAGTVGGVVLMLVSVLSYTASRTIVKRQPAPVAPVAPVASVPSVAPPPPLYAQQPPPDPEPADPFLDSPPAPSYSQTPRPAIVAPVTVTLPTASSI